MTRQATKDDVPELVRLSRLYLQETPHTRLLGTMTDEQLTTLVEHVLANGAAFVSEGADRLTGVLAVVKSTHMLTGEPITQDILWFLEEAERGNRTVFFLLDALEAWALKEGAVLVTLTAPADSRAGRLLQHYGYAPVETHYAKWLRGDDGNSGNQANRSSRSPGANPVRRPGKRPTARRPTRAKHLSAPQPKRP